MTEPGVPPAPQPPRAWYESTTLLVMALLIVGPFAVPLLWANRRVPLLVKIGGTMIIVAVTVWSAKVTLDLYARLRAELAQLNAALPH